MDAKQSTSNTDVFAPIRNDIERLTNSDHIEHVGILPDSSQITDKGLLYVDRQLDDSDSFIWREHQSRPMENKIKVPAAGRSVNLDHNSKEYNEAIDAGEELIKEMSASNFHIQMDEEEREQRIAELEAGYSLLRVTRVNPTTIRAVLGGVLAYLIAKFADEPIGELAKSAWITLKKLLNFD